MRYLHSLLFAIVMLLFTPLVTASGFEAGYQPDSTAQVLSSCANCHEETVLSNIKPTIGRIVLYHPDSHDLAMGMNSNGNDQPMGAQVAYVWGEGEFVNLSITDHNGATHSRTSVALLQPNDPVPEFGSYCEWMPYQKGQAAKTDELEDKLSGAESSA